VHDNTPTYWGSGMIEICSLDPARGERLLLGFKSPQVTWYKPGLSKMVRSQTKILLKCQIYLCKELFMYSKSNTSNSLYA